MHCKFYLPNGWQTRITLHLANIKWKTGLTAPRLSLLTLAVFGPNICYNYCWLAVSLLICSWPKSLMRKSRMSRRQKCSSFLRKSLHFGGHLFLFSAVRISVQCALKVRSYYIIWTFIPTTDILRRDTDWINLFLTEGLSSGTHMIIQNAVWFQCIMYLKGNLFLVLAIIDLSAPGYKTEKKTK